MSNAVATMSGGKALPALPDYIKGVEGANAIVKAGVGSGFNMPPQITPRGGKIRLKIDGEETTLMKRDEDGNEEPRSFVNVVIVDANPGKYKVYYAGKYKDGDEGEAPLCYSYDGERPSPYATTPQCKTCAACPHNVFGSMTTEQGNKTRACSDNKILAVLPYDSVKARAKVDTLAGTAFMLKVSPTGLSRNKKDRKDNPSNNTSLAEYIALLDNYPANGSSVTVPIAQVATRVFLDKQTDYPLFRYRLAGFLEPEEIEYVKERAAGDDIKAIISDQGTTVAPVAPVDDGEEFEQPAATKVTTAPAKVVAPAALPTPKPAARINDDDEDAPAPKLPAGEKEAMKQAQAAADRDDDDDPPAHPPPATTRRGRPPKPAAAEPAKVPEPVRTSARIDDELKSIASLF